MAGGREVTAEATTAAAVLSPSSPSSLSSLPLSPFVLARRTTRDADKARTDPAARTNAKAAKVVGERPAPPLPIIVIIKGLSLNLRRITCTMELYLPVLWK